MAGGLYSYSAAAAVNLQTIYTCKTILVEI